MAQNDLLENEAAENGEQQPDQPETQDEQAALKMALEQANDKYLRLVAEFENYKKRTATERIELIKTAAKDVILSLLPVLDDMERAMKNMQDADNIGALKEGVQLIQQKLYNTLSAKGLKPIASAGEDFDVEKHEAITKIPVEEKNKKGKVIEEIEKGYTLHDKIIRYAKVIVGE